MASPSPMVPGFRFKDGVLTIRREDAIVAIDGWPDPSAATKAPGDKKWRPLIPEFRLVKPYRPAKKKRGPHATSGAGGGDRAQLDLFAAGAIDPRSKPSPLSPARARKRAFDSFRFSLPKDVARVLEPHRSHQWPMLVFLAHDPGGIDLAGSNPVLGYLLAQRLACDVECIRLVSAGTMRQRDLLRFLKLPETNGMVKILRKIAPESVHGGTWRSLVGALRNPGSQLLKRLSHVSQVNVGVMELLVNPEVERHISPGLLSEVAEDRREKYCAATVALIEETLAMLDELEGAPHRSPVTFESVERLKQIHEDTSRSFAKLRVFRRRYGTFPRPPIPGVDGVILPLSTADMLRQEGEAQGNCVASYAGRMQEGKLYIYRVLDPERATLSIRCAPSGDWEISELKARFNGPVRPETRHAVERWLQRYSFGV